MRSYMVKYLLFFALTLTGFASPIHDHKIDLNALSQLCEALEIPFKENLVAETQKRWLRKPGQERWEMEELSSDQRQFVLNWAKQNGLFEAWTPATQSYDKALILGATTSRMKMRLNYLSELWNQGIRFSEIVWLTGDRLLDPRVDDLTDRCRNESEAARILWEEAKIPEEMRSLPVLFIAVPMKEDGRRPNAQDTIVAWLNHSSPCTALFVSNQPFCGFQSAVIYATLPNEYLFDVVGKGIDHTNHLSAATVLDTLSRWIYQEDLIQKQNQTTHNP
jgi:hypothetical protein